MHGRPRKAATPEDENASALKASKLRSLQSQFLQFHHTNTYTKDALEVSARLLEANPEYYTAWNYRKLAVEYNLSSQSDSDSIKSILDEELRLVENALKKNYKSYGAWHHRKWVLSKEYSSTDRELRLLNLFQMQDSRNFHAWNYRRFVAALRNISDEEELQFTTEMINNNFSNYSAWHNRSVLLSRLLKERVQGYFPKENVLVEEYEFVRNALFVDPDDQSGWFYHLWLLAQTVKQDTLSVTSWPPCDSDVQVPLDGCALHPVTYLHSSTRKIPVVLYFSEAVRGVSLTTVTIKTEYDAASDLTWRPLSMNLSGCAQAWGTYLDYSNEKIHSSKTYQVKVHVGDSAGISSLSGINYNRVSSIIFTISLSPSDSHFKEQIEKKIWWNDENFLMCEACSKNSSPLDLLYKLKMKNDREPSASNWQAETIATEIAHCRELLSFSDCKIGKLTLARLLMAHDAMTSNSSLNAISVVHSDEILKLYQDLMKMDPTHSQYYKDEYSLVLLKQVTSKESVLGYCRQYRMSDSISISDSICLRLTNLSLSRIGSIEQLLWVRMLDLSHNHLRSIEGLEAMQLLSCLNISHNKLGSFSALDPLRLLRSLEVLDISYNEIGAHSVDTRRYLCSSPLSHTVGSDWNLEERVITGVEEINYWEAISIFKCLNLRQLDIVGNAVAKENFNLFLCKLIPGLRWLDGEEVHQ